MSANVTIEPYYDDEDHETQPVPVGVRVIVTKSTGDNENTYSHEIHVPLDAWDEFKSNVRNGTYDGLTSP